jgi:hypothetical protein
MLALALLGVALGLALPASPANSQTGGAAPATSTPAPAATAKALTPQRQRMKDCGAKWKEEKASTGVKGRAAYNKFMRQCLKKPAA